jgi:putative addiction module component (TIGR02574 family)
MSRIASREQIQARLALARTASIDYREGVNTRARKVLDEALDLPPGNRALIAAELEASLDDASAKEVEEAWTKELSKRLREVREGRVKAIPAEKVLRDARKRLRAGR